MKRTCFVLLRLMLLGVCLAHLGIGLGINFWPEFPKILAPLYGVTQVEWSPQFLYILRPIGAYMVVMGLLAAVAMVNPRKHSAIIYGIALLLILRGIQRIVFQSDIMQAFGIEAFQNMMNACFFAGQGVILFLLRLGAGNPDDAEVTST